MTRRIEVEDASSLVEKRLKRIVVHGHWDAECGQIYRQSKANAVSWHPPRRKGSTCDVLLDYKDTLKDLAVVARTPVEDSAISAMTNPSTLSALTRATNPLDLSPLGRLAKVGAR